jgi:hypothetical protein
VSADLELSSDSDVDWEPVTGRWRRWPCPRCGHSGHRFSVVCPGCEGLPWTPPRGEEKPSDGVASFSTAEDGSPLIAFQVLRPGVELEVRADGFFRKRYRFSTPAGFLGVLSRRFSAGADWLGADGREWRLDRMGVLGHAYLLRDGHDPIAAGEARGMWHGSYRIWQGDRVFALTSTGLSGRTFLLAVEDGPEVLQIQGGFVEPLRKIEVLSEVPVATVVLAAYFACRKRQGEGE